MGHIRTMRARSVFSFIFCIIFLTTGCNAPKKHLTQFNEMIALGDFEGAHCFASEKIHQKSTPSGEDLLWMLQIGSLDRLAGNYTASTQAFDTCEDMMKHFDSENSGLGHTIGAVAVNDNIVPYTGQIYDGVMVNTYKGLNFMIEGKFDLARVEFNRALDRQRRARELFTKEIQQLKEDIDSDKNNVMVQKSLDNPSLKTRLSEAYPSLYNYRVYPDFVNPFATYMAGVFFTVEGDYNKAVDLLKESAGMVGDNTYVLQDFGAVEQALNSGVKVNPTVWIVFENGLGPVKEEVRIDLPLFIATEKIRYVGIALPRLVYRDEAMPYLEVTAANGGCRTQILANIDAVVQTEFNKDFQGILTRAIISASAKAVAQYALQNNNNNNNAGAAIFMALYSFVTTAADVRIWTVLPKNIQVAQIPKPADGVVTLGGPGMAPISLNIPDCNHAIVYIKMLRDGMEPQIELMTF